MKIGHTPFIHAVNSLTRYLRWLKQTNIFTSKSQLNGVNTCGKRVSHLSLRLEKWSNENEKKLIDFVALQLPES